MSASLNDSDADGVTSPAMTHTRPLYWSVRRELWENRSLYIAPLAVGAVVLFGVLISMFRLARRPPLSVNATVTGAVVWINEPENDPKLQGAVRWQAVGPSGSWVSLGDYPAHWGGWDRH